MGHTTPADDDDWLDLTPEFPSGWDQLAFSGALDQIAETFPPPPDQTFPDPEDIPALTEHLRELHAWIRACLAHAEHLSEYARLRERLQGQLERLERFLQQIEWIVTGHSLPARPPETGRPGLFGARRARREYLAWQCRLGVAAERRDLLLHDALTTLATAGNERSGAPSGPDLHADP